MASLRGQSTNQPGSARFLIASFMSPRSSVSAPPVARFGNLSHAAVNSSVAMR